MTLKLLALDVDGVLAKAGAPVNSETAALVREIEARGVRIAFASGKPVYYLVGLARGLGVQSPLIIGENGCVIFDPSEMLETRMVDRTEEMNKLEEHVSSHFEERVWVQPNQVQITLFPLAGCKPTEVTSYIEQIVTSSGLNVEVMSHDDAIDIVPKGVDKGRALALLCEQADIDLKEVAAVGDGPNDIPMLVKSGISIAVGDKIKAANFSKQALTGEEAIQWIRSLMN